MSLKNTFAAVLLAGSVVFFPSISYGFNVLKTATVTKNSGEVVNIIAVDGAIEIGDADKIKALFNKTGFKNLWISSSGGVILDSLKIADFVRENNIKVVVPPKEKCASGCSLIFLAANEKYLHFTSKLGVHRSATVSQKEEGSSKLDRKEDEGSRVVDAVMLAKLVSWNIPLEIIMSTMTTSQVSKEHITMLSSVDLFEVELKGYSTIDDKEFFESKIIFSEENYK